ncbi:MAG: ATP-binding protein [Chitinophagaceae bacterium]|nr:MAG: ATP-binding protein [Chitinophagaceae bacterium]
MINRVLRYEIEKHLNKQKVTLLLGARRVGKTELLNTIYQKNKDITLWLDGEDVLVEKMLEERSVSNYSRVLEGYKLLIIDEAQYIRDISRKAKLMIDKIKPLHIILTGSSAFDLVQMGEPLTGRTITYHLFPLSQEEWQQNENPLQTKQNLESRLVFGSYPELSTISTQKEKQKYLNESVNIYLLKDILVFEKVRNAKRLKDLLVLLAHQIGSEVSSNELGRQLGMSKNTVERYLDLFQKSFIIYPLTGYSNNLRKEVTKSKKWYFYDNGIRNALTGNFQPLSVRNDTGELWEQYILNERMKYNIYRDKHMQYFFWRTYDGQEIDLIEMHNGKLFAFECKWRNKKVKPPRAFVKNYPDATFETVHQDNYQKFIT